MSVSVIIPFRAGCPERERVWEFLREERWLRWLQVGGSLHVTSDETSDEPGPWRKAVAIRRGLERGRGDVVVVADADCWSDSLDEAVELVRARRAAWVVPFDRVIRLSREATAMVLDRKAQLAPLAGRSWAHEERAYAHSAAGGIVVLRRSVALSVPMDERFEGWGAQDIAWGHALDTLAGPRRALRAPLLHLWHPRERPRAWHEIAAPNRKLAARYSRARGLPRAMRALLAGARAVE